MRDSYILASQIGVLVWAWIGRNSIMCELSYLGMEANSVDPDLAVPI